MKRVLLILGCIALSLCAFAQATGDFRSAATGNWSAIATWERFNGTTWVAATAAPITTDGVITIQSPHTVTITASTSANQVLISVGATLRTNNVAGITFTIDGNNGQAGSELSINGTFVDQSTSGGIAFLNGGTWDFGANGTLIKTTATSSNNWQSNYETGIANVTATANWILRKTAAAQPALSTTTPASGSYYPNLFIENNTGTAWTTPVGSSFSGTTAFPTVKGNLDIGGSGTNTVSFLNDVQHATGYARVLGNLIIRAGCSLRNYGNGTEVQGNITTTATSSIVYDSNNNRKLVFTGGNNQTVSGGGSIAIYDLLLNKTGGTVTLNQPLTIDNSGTFTAGIVNTTSTNLLIFADAATVSGANNLSFVNGPVRKIGGNAFTFPVGKNADYQALGVSASASSSFWTEDFGTGCSQGTLGGGFVSANGTWTETNGTNGSAANEWFVSAQEAGVGAGNCGTGCGGTNSRSLHIANVSTSPLAGLFCPTGDCGAAYDAGLGGGTVLTDKRIESPVINCTGKYNLQLSFNYMEGGATTLDNALLWYYDGSTWSMLVDIPKTSTCPSGQGLWTSYTYALPASADNNANVKIGFRWINNDDGAGADPSFAVDDIVVSESVYFTAEYFYANPQVVYNNVLAPTLNSISNCEYWILDRGPATATATKQITLTWDANSCNISTNIADMRVAHFDNTSVWQDEGNSATSGNTAAGTVTSNTVTSFSPFTLAQVFVPLPIELLNFDAQYVNGKVNLDWCTAAEINNDYFTVERSADGATFTELLRKDGAGNSDQQKCYSDYDYHPYSGTSYYRLKQTDFNGQFTYSAIRPVTIENEAMSVVNVSSDDQNVYLDLQCPSEQLTQVRITDATGRTIAVQQSPCTGRFTFSRATMAPGIYFVTVITAGKAESRKVLVN